MQLVEDKTNTTNKGSIIPETEERKADTKRRLASQLSGLARQLVNSGDLDKSMIFTGRKPVTAYRTRAEMIVAQNAPLAAAIQVGMLRGTIEPSETINRICDSILDRICGKARQQVDLFHNADGLARLDAYATWLQVQRSDSIEGQVKQLPETTS